MGPLRFHMIAGAPDPVAPFSHADETDGWVSLNKNGSEAKNLDWFTP